MYFRIEHVRSRSYVPRSVHIGLHLTPLRTKHFRSDQDIFVTLQPVVSRGDAEQPAGDPADLPAAQLTPLSARPPDVLPSCFSDPGQRGSGVGGGEPKFGR